MKKAESAGMSVDALLARLSRTRRNRVIRWAVGPMLLVLLAGSCGEEETRRRGMEFFNAVPFYLAVEVEGRARTVLEDGPSTGLPPHVVSAACRNYADWLLERSVGNDVRVLDAPSVLRAAELLSTEHSGSDVVRSAFADHVRGDDLETILDRLRADHGDEELQEVRAFFEGLSTRPSAVAQAGFVVYESAASTTSRLIVVTDSSTVDVVPVPRSRARYIRVEDVGGSLMRVPEERCWE